MKRFKIGVFGTGRGLDLARNFMLQNCEIVAICDNHEKRLQKAIKELGNTPAVYRDFDAFIEHDLDAVILANFFHEHAPYAIKCFERGIHVFSECISNGTMAEGVALVRAFEKSNSIYMMAENYPQMIFNREMKRICDNGTLGKIVYAEGEYNHPADPKDTSFINEYVYTVDHWRNYLPRSYYITHSLGPIMHATGATPKRVTSFAAFAPNNEAPTSRYTGDVASIITTMNDDGSIFRITGCAAFGAHHNSYRICGTKGQIENLRGMGKKVMLRYNKWDLPDGTENNMLYEPEWNDRDEEKIKLSGHGGGDYLTVRTFLECMEAGVQPEHPFDLYSAVNMSSVALLAHRSMLDGGMPYDIPDFHQEEARKQYEEDFLSPFCPPDGKKPSLPCCSNTDYRPTDDQIAAFKELLE